MSEKKKVHLYLRAIIGLLVYLFLFAWLNQFQFSGFQDESANSFGPMQSLAVLVFLMLGLLLHIFSIKGVKLINGLGVVLSYSLVCGVMYFISGLLWSTLAVGILGLMTGIFGVIIVSWLRKMQAENLEIKNLCLHLILSISLQLVLYNAQVYSNVLFLAIAVHWLFVSLCNLIYKLLAKYTSPSHSVALLICKQNYSYSGFFLLSLVFSLLLALIPRHVLMAHDVEEAYVLAHSWFFNLLVLVSIISVLLLVSHSVSSDFVNKNIFTIASKPISQVGYLAGKLLGVLLVVMPFMIYFLLTFLLIINVVIRFVPQGMEKEDLGNLVRVSEYINPDYLNSEEFLLSVEGAMKIDGYSDENMDKHREAYTKKQIEAYKYIPYRQKRTYKFPLPERVVGEFNKPINLVFLPRMKGGQEHSINLRMLIRVNDRPYRQVDGDEFLVCEANREVRLALNDYIDIDTRELKVEILNISDRSLYSGRRPAIYFGKYGGQGLELAIEDRSYIANCLKVILLMLVQICFAATLTLFAVSMLDFSVAILMAACLLIISYGHDFINDAVEYDTGLDRGKTFSESMSFRLRIILNSYTETGLFAAFKSVIANALDLFLVLIPSFKSFRVIADFSRGIYIDISMFVRLLLTLGVFWTPVYFLLSSLVMRKREPARLIT